MKTVQAPVCQSLFVMNGFMFVCIHRHGSRIASIPHRFAPRTCMAEQHCLTGTYPELEFMGRRWLTGPFASRFCLPFVSVTLVQSGNEIGSCVRSCLHACMHARMRTRACVCVCVSEVWGMEGE